MIVNDPIPISYIDSPLPEIIEIIKSEGSDVHPFNVDYFTVDAAPESTPPDTLLEATARRNPRLLGVMLSHKGR